MEQTEENSATLKRSIDMLRRVQLLFDAVDALYDDNYLSLIQRVEAGSTTPQDAQALLAAIRANETLFSACTSARAALGALHFALLVGPPYAASLLDGLEKELEAALEMAGVDDG